MPGWNGRELAREAERLRPGIRVLYMTGYSRNAVVHQGRLDEGCRPPAEAGIPSATGHARARGARPQSLKWRPPIAHSSGFLVLPAKY
jgi:hypothetical protein